MPEFHASLNAALARSSGPSAEDVEALARLVAEHGSWDFWSGATRCECGDELSLEGTPVPAGISVGEWRHAQHVARLLAAHTAAAEARGAERGARAACPQCQGDGGWDGPHGAWKPCPTGTCPACGHMPHSSLGFCPNGALLAGHMRRGRPLRAGRSARRELLRPRRRSPAPGGHTGAGRGAAEGGRRPFAPTERPQRNQHLSTPCPCRRERCVMSRLMSVAMTADAVIERRKTVTRRKGWWLDKNGRRLLRPGDTLTLCRKVQGRKPGEPIERLAEVEVVAIRREPLCAVAGPFRHEDDRIIWPEVVAEGFPDMDAHEFMLRFFIDAQGIGAMDDVTRIEWRYICGAGFCECGGCVL